MRCYKSIPIKSFSRVSTVRNLRKCHWMGLSTRSYAFHRSTDYQQPSRQLSSSWWIWPPVIPFGCGEQREEKWLGPTVLTQSYHSPFVPRFSQVEANGGEGAFPRLNLRAQYTHSRACLQSIFHTGWTIRSQPRLRFQELQYLSLVGLIDLQWLWESWSPFDTNSH